LTLLELVLFYDANGTSGCVAAKDEWLVSNVNLQGCRKKN